MPHFCQNISRREHGFLYQDSRKIHSGEPEASKVEESGLGTRLIYLLGIMLIGIAGAGLVMRRKRM